jgi:hypothetical protein
LSHAQLGSAHLQYDQQQVDILQRVDQLRATQQIVVGLPVNPADAAAAAPGATTAAASPARKQQQCLPQLRTLNVKIRKEAEVPVAA